MDPTACRLSRFDQLREAWLPKPRTQDNFKIAQFESDGHLNALSKQTASLARCVQFPNHKWQLSMLPSLQMKAVQLPCIRASVIIIALPARPHLGWLQLKRTAVFAVQLDETQEARVSNELLGLLQFLFFFLLLCFCCSFLEL